MKKEEELEPCIECTMSDLETILELQREVCDYERFCSDLFIDIRDGFVREHIQYATSWATPILDVLRKRIRSYDDKTTN